MVVLYDVDLGEALRQNYGEDTIKFMVENIKGGLNEELLNIALTNGYSQEFTDACLFPRVRHFSGTEPKRVIVIY